MRILIFFKIANWHKKKIQTILSIFTIFFGALIYLIMVLNKGVRQIVKKTLVRYKISGEDLPIVF